MVLQRFFAIILAIFALSVPAFGQDEEEIVCVGGARFWSGDLADIAAIEREPIPESFRSTFELKDGPCARWGLVPSSLLQWHKRFGTETSTRVAAKYLSENLIKSARNYVNPEDKIDALATAANYYYLASLGFDDLSMIQKAEALIVQANEIASTLPPSVLGDGWSNPEFSGMRTFRGGERDYALSQLTQDIAVRKAFVTGTKEDAERARSFLTEWPDSVIQEVTSEAQKSFDSVCDVNRSAETPDTGLEKLCNDTLGNLTTEIRLHLVRSVLLATIESRFGKEAHANRDADATYDVERLLFIAEAEDCCAGEPDYDNPYNEIRFRLHLAFADMYAHFSAGIDAPSDNKGRLSKFSNLRLSLDQLLMAERFAPRHSMPTQWRRVALRYVRIAEQFDSTVKGEDDESLLWDEHVLPLRYFRQELGDFASTTK